MFHLVMSILNRVAHILVPDNDEAESAARGSNKCKPELTQIQCVARNYGKVGLFEFPEGLPPFQANHHVVIRCLYFGMVWTQQLYTPARQTHTQTTSDVLHNYMHASLRSHGMLTPGLCLTDAT